MRRWECEYEYESPCPTTCKWFPYANCGSLPRSCA